MQDTILVVEDDIAILESVEIYLKKEGYKVIKAVNGLEAVEIMEDQHVDLILMDIMMSVMDGATATLKIRENSVVPIIFLSAKSEDVDKIMGLNLGADDYITKPFNPSELMARVRSHLRRYKHYSKLAFRKLIPDAIEIGGLQLSFTEKSIYIDGDMVRLTPLEYKILLLLMKNPGQVFSIEEIYERVWKEPAVNAETVTVHIRRIREKIEIDPKNPRYLKVVWGVGYKFVRPEEID